MDPGVTVQLDNDNHQILYGRRGTGKTHVLKVIQSGADALDDEMAIYVDMRVLGSSQIYEDLDRPYDLRVTSLLAGVLEEIRVELLERATAPGSGASISVLNKLEQFDEAAQRTVLVSEEVKRAEAESSKRNDSASVGASLRLTGDAGFHADASAATEAARQNSTEVVGARIKSIRFQEVGAALLDVVKGLGLRRLVLLLDEWTAVPMDLQPVLAEFLKRSIMPYPEITLKIASIEYRSNFNREIGHNNVIGFEMGPDISSAPELDDYYVYDRNPTQTAATFAELLYRHIKTEAEDLAGAGYLARTYAIRDAERFRQRIFASPEAFIEAVRAGEGVSRDFISIFSAAFFNSLRRSRASVDLQSIREAARDYYEKDKSGNVDSTQSAALQRITNEVIGKKQARTFMIEKSLEGHDLVRSLFDLRIIHLARRGYADKDNPGVRYNIFTLDYGTYVDLMGTKKAPLEDPATSDDVGINDVVVPFDNMKSIRRIILRREHLEPTAPRLFESPPASNRRRS